MLRRKLSAGLLRATAPSPAAQAPSVVAGAVAGGRARSRSLASAVLLSSQRNWKGETVVALKAELKKRGLSQQGNKSTLVTRIESAETSSALGPLPPFQSSSSAGSSGSIGSRSLSTSAQVAQPPKSKKSAPSSATEKGEVANETVTSTGADVSSEKHDSPVPKAPSIEPELITVAPGLPETKAIDVGGKETLDLKFPKPKAREEIDQVIPVTPDNYNTLAVPSTEDASLSPTTPSAPKILTVASASTHLSGGPVHGVHDSVDSHALEVDNTPSLNDLPSFSEAMSNVFLSPGRAWTSIGAKFPEVHLPPAPSSKDGQGEYKSEKRALNAEERRGAWILAGVVGLGYFLGGGGGSKKGDSHAKGIVETAEELAEKAQGYKPVKGDANWEKPTGAGLVGHGVRKD